MTSPYRTAERLPEPPPSPEDIALAEAIDTAMSELSTDDMVMRIFLKKIRPLVEILARAMLTGRLGTRAMGIAEGRAQERAEAVAFIRRTGEKHNAMFREQLAQNLERGDHVPGPEPR